MILPILFGALLVVGLIIMLVSYLIEGDYDCPGFYTGLTIAILFFIVNLFSVPSVIVANICPEAKIIEWEEKISYLQNKKDMLQSEKPIISPEGDIVGFTSDIYLHYDNPQNYYRDVDDYNKEVSEFRIKLKSGKYYRANVWFGAYHEKAYTMIDISIVDNLTYTIGK